MQAKNRIIIVDDDEDFCKTISMIFKKKGYEIDIAMTGHEAIEKAQEKYFNIVLLDNKLPDIDGTELIAPLKEMHPDVEVIMITANSDIESAIQSLNKGASAYFLKPLNIDNLLASVRNSLEKQQLINEKRETERKLRESEKNLRKLNEKLEEIVMERTEELKRSEQNYKNERDKLISILNSMTDGVYVVNQQHEIEYVNPALIKEFGPVKNQKCHEYTKGFSGPCSRCKFQDVLAGKTIVSERYYDKNQKTYEVVETPLKSPDITISKLKIFRNITERKLAEQKLKESEERYRNLVNNIADTIVQINVRGIMTYLSPQIREIGGYDPEQLIGCSIFNLIPPEEKTLVENAIKRVAKFNEMESIETSFLHERGFYYIPVSIKFNLASSKEKVKIVGLLSDISKRKRAENMIKQQIKKLEELDFLKDEFITRASHEFKTPLNSILSASTILLNECKSHLEENDRKLLDIINNGGEMLKNLVQDLLDVSKIDSNKLRLKKKKCNIVKIIKDIINDLKSLTRERKIAITFDCNEIIYMEVDMIRIEQVILNLIGNAIKNSPLNSEISIALELNEEELDIKIKDNGIGFTREEKEKIFKKFGKIEREGFGMDVSTEGSGLGLYISKEIVELHGGKVLLESEGRNKGSTLVVRLPINKN